MINKTTGKMMSFVVNKSDPINDEKKTEVVMREMRKQLEGDGLEYDPSLVKYSKEDQDSLNDIKDTNKLIDELESEIESIGSIENIQDNSQLKGILKKFDESSSLLDKFISREHHKSIKRIIDITEE